MELGHGIYTPMDINLLPPLYLIYADNPSDSGKVYILVDPIVHLFSTFIHVLAACLLLHE